MATITLKKKELLEDLCSYCIIAFVLILVSVTYFWVSFRELPNQSNQLAPQTEQQEITILKARHSQ